MIDVKGGVGSEKGDDGLAAVALVKEIKRR